MSNPTLEDEVIAFLSDMADSISIFIRKISGKETQQKTLAEFEPGAVVKIGGHEMVVLEQMEGRTALIRKNCLKDKSRFGVENNNYAVSAVDDICETFADEITETVGGDHILVHDVVLTALTGDDSYGVIARYASLLTLAQYQRYVDILDQHKPDQWWWLSTPSSTKRHENDLWALCVSPSGLIGHDLYNNLNGARPFYILNSSIFGSCDE